MVRDKFVQGGIAQTSVNKQVAGRFGDTDWRVDTFHRSWATLGFLTV